MKVSLDWLSEWIDTVPQNIADQLTMAGLEVDQVLTAAPVFTEVVVGQVIALSPHPDADKLRVAMVDVGLASPLQIVCGAPNVTEGIKVPVAMIGAELPNGLKIKHSQLRGVDSMGMLCSAKELGITDDQTGLWVLPQTLQNGCDLRQALSLDDQILEVDLTPNRGDCLSMQGMAREIALINNLPFKPLAVPVIEAHIQDTVSITVEAQKDCPRYLARLITQIDTNVQTPFWMVERLRRAGIRSHQLLVDVTNYLLILLGQPMHAFDADKIVGHISVRRADIGEKIILLTGEEITLTPEILVIADDLGPIAMAGIMGGARTACDATTQRVLLESAWFNPITIAGKARLYGLQTDAAHRYERGVDFNLPRAALETATDLLITLAGGQASEIFGVESLEQLPKRDAIHLSCQSLNQRLGLTLSDTEIYEILQRIDINANLSQGVVTLVPPSYRYDLEIQEDLIEEVARLYGYDNIPTTNVNGHLQMSAVKEAQLPLMRFKNLLVDRDYMEAITMSFISPEWQKLFDPMQSYIALKNPIAIDLSVMRTSLMAGLVKAIDHNLKRQQKRLRFFESGLIFRGSTPENLQQIPVLGGAICGDYNRPEWGVTSRKVDFFDLKGDVEALLALANHEDCSFIIDEHPAFHPGKCAKIIGANGQSLGILGALHPQLLKTLDLPLEIFVFELYVQPLSQRSVPTFKEISKFPFSRRDLALVVPHDMTVQQVIHKIKESDAALLSDIELFDIYHDSSKLEHSKSMAFSLTFQNPLETVTDEQIDASIAKIIDSLRNINITLRQ